MRGGLQWRPPLISVKLSERLAAGWLRSRGMPQVVRELLPAFVDGLEVRDTPVVETLNRQPIHDRKGDRDGDADDGLAACPVFEVFEARGWAAADEVEAVLRREGESVMRLGTLAERTDRSVAFQGELKL